MQSKVCNTLSSNYWSELSSGGSSSYERRAVPKAPTAQELSEHLEKSMSDALWSESILMQKTL